jgi:putative tricarboxylic transport membrane protein
LPIAGNAIGFTRFDVRVNHDIVQPYCRNDNGRLHVTDRIILGVMLVLAAVYFHATAQIPVLEIGDSIGPKAFPRLLGIGLLVAAAMLFMEIWRARKAPQDQRESAPVAERPGWGFLGAAVGWTAIYLAAFEFLGFVVATSAYLVVCTAYFNRGKWVTNLVTSVLFSVLIYLLFKYLGVNLPAGVLPL